MGDDSKSVPVVVAVATRLRQDEAAEIDALAFGVNRADKLRVLIRFGLSHPKSVQKWLDATDGQPVDD